MKQYVWLIALWMIPFAGVHAQREELRLTLQQAIDIAREQSLDAQAARHSYRAAYWNYRFFKANYLPSVTLSSSPNLNKQINKVTQPDGTVLFIRQNQLTTDLNVQINQNIAFTGGNLFVKSTTQRMDEFEGKVKSWNSNPVIFGYEQALFGYNALKWDKRIEPIRYREAQKAYAETMELVASRACLYFFDLATAQANLDIATFNYQQADTLYIYAEGRYNIGTINENEMLQLELNKLTEETNMMNARIHVDDQMQRLRSFLGYGTEVDLLVVPDDRIPSFDVPLDKALQMAFEYNPDPEMFQRQVQESKSELARAKANAGLKADLYVQFGLSQTGNTFAESYKDPINQQYASISIRFPLLDWGRGKGRVRVARSNVDLVETRTEQGLKDFELNVCKMVRQFNLQAYHVTVAAKTDKTAKRRNDVARKLYLLGKSTILDLNASISEKDMAHRNYIGALKTYWSLYYGIRSITRYDFEHDRLINTQMPD